MDNAYFMGMIQHSVVSNVSNVITKKLNTDNVFVNTIVMLFTMTLMSYLITILRNKITIKILKNIILNNINKITQNTCAKKTIYIEFIAKSNTGRYFEYSDAYLSILHYINTNKEISSIIKSKEELEKRPEWNPYYYDEEEQEENNMFIKKDVIYRITDLDKIILTPNITCQFINKNIEKNQKNGNDEYKTVSIECYSIVLSTKTQDINFIQNFVDKIYSEYIEYKNNSCFKGQMYFSYEGKSDNKDNGRQIWKEFKWKTNKTYKNIFLEDKDKILSNIDKLTKMQEFNKRIGRPNQMNILIWGSDFGCGKTSLLKAICNVQFPDRHIININLAKIKTCKELEDIFMCPSINGRVLKLKQCVFIIDEVEKCCPILRKDYSENDDVNIGEFFKKHSKKFNIETDEEKNDLNNIMSNIKMNTFPKTKDDDKLNLGFILSLLDGPIEYHDRVMIFTANNIDELHPGFIRPGRMDMCIHVKKATIQTIINIISFIFEYNISDNSQIINKIKQNIRDYDICPSAVYEGCYLNYTNDINDKLNNINKTIDFIIEKINN